MVADVFVIIVVVVVFVDDVDVDKTLWLPNRNRPVILSVYYHVIDCLLLMSFQL